MKKILLILTVFLLAGLLQAQTFRIGPSFGLSKQQDLSIGNVSGSDLSLGLDNDMHYGLTAKLDLHAINLTAHIFKGKLSGKESIAIMTNQVDVEYEADLISAGIGVELTLIPGPVNVYVAGDFLFTFSSNGKAKTSNAFGTIETTFDSGSDQGLGIGAGIDFKVLPLIDIDLTARYNMNNMFSKEDGEVSWNTIEVTATVLFPL